VSVLVFEKIILRPAYRSVYELLNIDHGGHWGISKKIRSRNHI